MSTIRIAFIIAAVLLVAADSATAGVMRPALGGDGGCDVSAMGSGGDDSKTPVVQHLLDGVELIGLEMTSSASSLSFFIVALSAEAPLDDCIEWISIDRAPGLPSPHRNCLLRPA